MSKPCEHVFNMEENEDMGAMKTWILYQIWSLWCTKDQVKYDLPKTQNMMQRNFWKFSDCVVPDNTLNVSGVWLPSSFILLQQRKNRQLILNSQTALLYAENDLEQAEQHISLSLHMYSCL